jgi:hypothetical protein
LDGKGASFDFAMPRFYTRLIQKVRKVIGRRSDDPSIDQNLVARIPIVGARFEENGWSIEIRRDSGSVQLAICGTYGERVAGGSLSANRFGNMREATLFPIDCGDIVLDLSKTEWATEIRTLGGQLIGHVARARLTECLLGSAGSQRGDEVTA